MVVRVLIIACFIKLHACNPYLSSTSNAKFPAITSFATKVSPGGSTNQVPDLQPYNSYSYNVPQKTTQPVDEVKLSKLNKVSRPVTITPLPVTPEPYMPDTSQYNGLPFGIKESKTDSQNLADDSMIFKITNDMPTPKYQHKPFSTTFNNFRENLFKTMDSGFKSKSPPTSASENVNTVHAEALKQMPKFIKPQISPSTTPPLQPKDYLPEFVINNDMIKQQENEGLKEEFLIPVDAAKYKDHTVNEEKISENSLQISRVPYNNNINPFMQISNGKENNFGKLNPNIQAKQDVYHNLPSNKNIDRYVSQMQPLSVLPFKPQESPLVVPVPAPLNQSLPVPHKEERNVSQALRIPYYNKLNPFNSILLNNQLISDNQTFRENQLRMDPNSSLQLQTSRMPYNNNYNNIFHSKLLTQPSIPGNQSMQEDPLVKMNQSRSPQGNINNILPKYNDKDKSVPQIQPLRVVPPNPQQNASVIASPDLISQPAQILHNEKGNLSQMFRAPYYNSFYRPYPKSFSQQLIPGNQLLEEDKLETLDPIYSAVERNETQMPPSSVMTSTLYENTIRAIAAGTELRSQPAQTVNGEKNSQIYRTPNYTNVNILNPKALPISKNQILQENQSVKTDPLSSPQMDINENLQHKNAINSMPQMSALPTLPQENLPEVSALEVENQRLPLSYKEENESQIIRVPYYNHLDTFISNTKENHFKKTEQLTSSEMKINHTLPNNTSTDKSVPQIQLISVLPSNHQLNPSQYTDLEIISQPTQSADKKEPELNMNLIHSIVDGDVLHAQSLSELPSEPKENLSEYLQLIDGTENMRTKNEIATPAYYPEPKNKCPQISHEPNNKILENEYQTSRMPYYSKCNPFNSRGLNQQPPNNQILKDNRQLLNTNQNFLPQETNYGEQISKIPNKIEPQMPLFISQPNNEKFVLPTHSFQSSPDDARINSEVTKLFGTPDPKNSNSSLAHNDSILRYELHASQLPYYNSFDPFTPYALNQQILHSSQVAKDNQIPKPNQRIMPQDSSNIMTPNKNGNDPQTSRLHENSASPMQYLHSDSENSRLDNKVAKPYDTPDPKNLPGDVSSVHRIASETSRLPSYNSLNPFLNALSRQTVHNNKMTEDNQLIKSHQDFPQKQDVNNINSQFQEKPQDYPALNRFTNQGNSIIKNKITKVSDDSEPTKQHFTSSHDVRRFENEFQANTIPYYNNFNSNVLNQQLSHDNQMTNEDPSNKLTITDQNTLPKLDININIPNADNADKNIPMEITITETPDESCIEKNDNTSPNIIIDLHNKNEKPCKCHNATQKCDEISTNIEVFIPCFTEETDVTKENNYTNSTEKSSKSKEIIPTVDPVDLDDFSSYLADTILSAVQSFLIQPNGSSASMCVTENYMNITDKNISSCNCSEPEILLQPNLDIPLLNTDKSISEPSNKIKECTTLLQNIEEVSSPILGTHSTKQHCPRILESNEVKNDTEPKVCLEPNISSDEKIINETSKKHPALKTTAINGISSNQHSNTLEPVKITKESYIGLNEIHQIPSKSDDKQYSNTSNPDGEVLESANRIRELCTSTNKTHQVPPKKNEKPLDANKNEDTSSNQTSQILLPYYYYIDQINITSNETNQTIPKSNAFGTSEDEEKNGVISPANDSSAIETTIDNNPEVRRLCGPKPCLSKITVNILPMAEKNNHDILVFL